VPELPVGQGQLRSVIRMRRQEKPGLPLPWVQTGTADSRLPAMILSCPPQFGQCSRSISNTSLGNRTQLIRAGRLCVQPDSVAVSSDALVANSDA